AGGADGEVGEVDRRGLEAIADDGAGGMPVAGPAAAALADEAGVAEADPLALVEPRVGLATDIGEEERAVVVARPEIGPCGRDEGGEEIGDRVPGEVEDRLVDRPEG